MLEDTKNMPKISIIAAMGKNKEIGIDNSLPWEIKEDLIHFKKKTMGKPVIMGQKTFESVGKPFPGRTNIILSQDKNFKHQDCLIAESIDDALKKAGDVNEIMIIGGASVYPQFLPLADRMYLTLINDNFKANVFFPDFDFSEWKEIEKENKESKKYKYAFIVLDKK